MVGWGGQGGSRGGESMGGGVEERRGGKGGSGEWLKGGSDSVGCRPVSVYARSVMVVLIILKSSLPPEGGSRGGLIQPRPTTLPISPLSLYQR